MSFKEIQTNNIIYCIFSDNSINPLRVDDIVNHNSYYSFKGTSVLTDRQLSWAIMAGDMNKETTIDAATTIEGAREVVIHRYAVNNKTIREAKKWRKRLKN